MARSVQGATTVKVRKIECWDDQRKITRVTFQINKDPKWKVGEYDSPPRVLVRLYGSELDNSIWKNLKEGAKFRMDFDKGIVDKVETWEADGNSVYLYIYLKEKAKPNIYTKSNYLCIDFEKPKHLQKAQESPEQVRARKSVLTKMIVLDAGHGGEDTGCLGLYGTVEKDINMKITRMLAELINNQGNQHFHAYLSREADFYPTLEERVAFANELAAQGGADCFVSIHCNSARSRNANGVEIFRLSESEVNTEARNTMLDMSKSSSSLSSSYQREALAMLTRLRVEDSDRLGLSLLDKMCSIPGFARRAKDAKQARFRVLRNLTVPGVLVEAGFLSNWNDASKLRKMEVQQQVAWKIYEGLKDYFNVDIIEQPRMPQMASVDIEDTLVASGLHTVKRGESLWSISKRHGVTVKSLAGFNNIRGNLVKVGQVLVIPGSSSAKYSASEEEKESTYKVKLGDSLYSISKKYGVSVQDIRTRNKIGRRSIIHPGDSLIIPLR